MAARQLRTGRGVARAGVWSAYPSRGHAGASATRLLPLPIALLLGFGCWLMVVRAGIVPQNVLPDPLAVLDRAWEWASRGIIWRYLAPTLQAALLGAAISVAVALPLGILTAHSRLLAAVIEPVVAFSQTIPLVAIAPLLVLWLGYGTIPIALLCAIIAFFPMITTTVVGLRSLDVRVIEHAWLDGADGWQRLWHVELPIVAPAILAGIRAGLVLSMTGAIVGEFVMGGSGLGTLLTISREALDVVGVFAVLLWIVAIAFGLQEIVHLAERASANRIQGEDA